MSKRHSGMRHDPRALRRFFSEQTARNEERAAQRHYNELVDFASLEARVLANAEKATGPEAQARVDRVRGDDVTIMAFGDKMLVHTPAGSEWEVAGASSAEPRIDEQVVIVGDFVDLGQPQDNRPKRMKSKGQLLNESERARKIVSSYAAKLEADKLHILAELDDANATAAELRAQLAKVRAQLKPFTDEDESLRRRIQHKVANGEAGE